jgi:predicted nucleic acid-binding protein
VAGRGQEVVVDSSVAVKWFSIEEDTDKAVVLRDQHLKGTRQVWASDLLYHEVANALRFKRTYDESKLSEAVNALFSFHLNNWRLDQSLLRSAATVAYRGGVTIYDAVPVALASMRGITCVTADEETQYKKLKPHGYPVTLLSEEPLSNP